MPKDAQEASYHRGEKMQAIRKTLHWLLRAVVAVLVVLSFGTSPDDHDALITRTSTPVWLRVFHRWEFDIDCAALAICIIVFAYYVYGRWHKRAR